MTARYEHRVFLTERPTDLAARLAVGATRSEVRGGEDTYLLPRAPGRNVKLRAGRLEVKEVVERDGALERWKPAFAGALPLDARAVAVGLLPALDVVRRPLPRGRYDLEALLEDLPIDAVAVAKRRRRLELGDGTAAEVDRVEVASTTLWSVAFEAEDPDLVRRHVAAAGLAALPAESYPALIERILGASVPAPVSGVSRRRDAVFPAP